MGDSNYKAERPNLAHHYLGAARNWTGLSRST